MRRACLALAIVGCLAGPARAGVPLGFPPLGFTPLPPGVAESHARSVPAPAALPESLDWRDSGIITSPKAQSDCGACWAFAGIACIEAMCVMAGASSALDLSEQYPISCDTQPLPEFGGFRNDGCCGGSCTVFEFFRDHPLIAENRFPYGEGDFDGDGARDCDPTPGWATVPCPDELPTATGWLVEDWSLIYPQPVPGVAQLKAALQNGPVWVGFYVYQDFYTYWLSSERVLPYRHVSGPMLGGHAVLLIGYNDPGQYWIAKNSWGNAGPFRNGTFRIHYSAGCDFGLNAATVTVTGSGTPVQTKSWGAIKAMFR
jgi:hypothetical protein